MPRSSMVVSLLIVGCLSGGLAGGDPCPARAAWPTTGWPSRVDETARARATEIAALEQFAFRLVGKDEERKGARTDAVIIVQRGAIVYEKYARGFTAEMRHYTWSMSKSFTNALTGIAVARGALTIEDSICRHLPATRADRCNIKVRDLLEFASGLRWTEVYEDKSNQASSVLAMLYGVGRRDMAAFVAGHEARDPPGATYMYSTGDTTLLAGVVDRAMRARGSDDQYPWTLLFTPLGMADPVFERDATGTPVGGSFVWATPRDLAKFGYFLLSDGCWEGARHLPEGWLRDSTTPSLPFKRHPIGNDPDDVQGRQFWLNRPVPEQKVTTPWPGVPEDAYAARGHWGQSITVIPSRDLVVVRMADDREKGFDFAKLLQLAIAVGAP